MAASHKIAAVGAGAAIVLCLTLGSASAQAARSRRSAECERFRSGSLSLLIEGGAPTPLEASPEGALLESFALLRRPAQAADEVPALNPLSEELGPQLAGYYPGYVRRLATLAGGIRVMLVLGLPRVAPAPPVRCLSRAERPHRRRLLEERVRRARTPVYCEAELAVVSHLSGESSCVPFADLYSGANLLASASSTTPVAELVPDGVASVRLSYSHAAALTAPVEENAYVFTPPQDPVRRAQRALESVLRAVLRSANSPKQLEAALKRHTRALARARRLLEGLPPTRVEWLSPSGSVVRTMTPPRRPPSPLGPASGPLGILG